MTQVKNKKVLVMGLGRFGGGVGVTKWLVEQRANVTVTDLKTAGELRGSISQLENSKLEIKWTLGKHDSQDVKNADLIIVNPAVKPDSPYLKIASKHRVSWTTEVNLFLERCPCRVIGVTGTNGKETVVRMIEMVLRKKFESRERKVWVGGNIGKTLLDDLPKIKVNDVVILELSSFQLAWLPIIKYSPDIAVIVNLTPDHLDWHGTMVAYTDAKANILRYQEKTDVAVLNWLDKRVKALAKKARGSIVKVSQPTRIKLTVPGEFNKLNVALAVAVAGLFKIDKKTSRNIIKEFKGVPHALEFVVEKDGVKYYNDSAATTPDATQAALAAFDRKVILIIGGCDKKLPLKSLAATVKKQAKFVYAIGTTGEQIHELLQHKHNVVNAKTLEKALVLAAQRASRGDIVLLSPAAASYDQFNNLEERGERFKQLVNLKS